MTTPYGYYYHMVITTNYTKQVWKTCAFCLLKMSCIVRYAQASCRERLKIGKPIRTAVKLGQY